MPDNDQNLTLADIASVPQIADELGLTLSGAWRYAANWPDVTIHIGGRRFFVRSRLIARLASVDLRPRSRKGRRPPTSPMIVAGDAANGSE